MAPLLDLAAAGSSAVLLPGGVSPVDINLVAGWAGILVGFLAGAFEGLFFHRPDWRGGYAAWSRRMTRLAHISFFGIGVLNLAYALTLLHWGYGAVPSLGTVLLPLAAVTMPALCYLSAWKPSFRHLFFIPALSLIASVGALLIGVLS